MSALAGVRVLELTSGWSAAALAGRILVDLAAEVIALEPPAGDPLRSALPVAADGQSHAFHLLAAGKRSVALTGAPDADREMLATLAAAADVLVTDEGGHAHLGALGLGGVDQLHPRWPHLVTCSITPFGLRGPLAGWHAGELTLEAMSGAMATTGYAGRGPTRAGVPLGAHVAALLSTTAILAALRVRESGQPGQWIDMAVHDALVACLGTFLPTWFLDGKTPDRLGNRHAMNAPWNTFRCADGWVVVCAGTDRLWTALVRAIGRDDLAAAPGYATIAARVRRIEDVERVVRDWTGGRTVRAVIERLDGAGVPVAPVSDVSDLLRDPHFLARAMVTTVPGHRGVPVPTIGPLAKFRSWTRSSATGSIVSGTLGSWTRGVERGAPALGEATVEVMRRARADVRSRPPAAAAPGGPPLAGVRVLEMGSFTAGPAGVRLLGALGADVVKVEPPDGEACRHLAQKLGGDAYLFHLNNTDKRSLVIDLGTASAREALMNLAAASDVFLESFAPGTAEGWGLGAAALLERNPRLVYCSVSGFGHSGLGRGRRAFDTVIQATAGVMALTGFPADPPVKLGMSISDLLGAFLAPVAILAGLRVRDRTAAGQHVDVSMHDVTGWLTASTWPAVLARAHDSLVGPAGRPAAEPRSESAAASGGGSGGSGDRDTSARRAPVNSPPATECRAGGDAAWTVAGEAGGQNLASGPDVATRHGNRHPEDVPSNLYVAADGRAIVIEVRDDEEWRRLVRAMRRGELAADTRYATATARRMRAADLDALVAAWVAARPGDEVLRAAQAAGVPSGPVLGVPEVAEHEHTVAREMIVTRTHSHVGPVRLLGVPLKLTRSDVAVRRAAPVLGADAAEVLRAGAG